MSPGTPTLPPLCNLFAALVPNPTEREKLRCRLEESGAFASVVTVARDWLVGAQPLPGLRTIESELAGGFVFVEGGDLFTDPSSPSLAHLGTTVDHQPERLAEFPGDFGFVRFTPETATVVRSCAGRVPFYYRETADRIFLASRLDYIVAFAQAEPTLDGLAATAILAGCCVFPEGRAPIRDVKCLSPGCYAVLKPGKAVSPRSYWSPRQPLESIPSPKRRDEQALQLHEILLDTLRRELPTDGGSLLFFSGGVDSSALAALTCEGLGRPLFTQTFTCPDEATARYEDQYILPLERRYGFARSWREVKTSARCLELAQKAPKISLPTLHLGASLLAEIGTEAKIRVALDGEFADEGCGSPRRIGDWLDHTSFSRVLGQGASTPLGRLAPLRWFSWRAKRPFHRQWLYLPETPPQGTRADIQHEYSDWIALERRRFATDRLPLRTLAFRVSRDQWLAEAWEATTSLGVRPLSAFYTRAALELYFACHPEHLFDGSRPKALLRRAMQGYMPESHRLRPDKGEWPPFLELARGKARLYSRSRALELLDERWLTENFRELGGSAPASAEMSLFDALRITSLGNMLSAIDRLVGSKPFPGVESGNH